MPGRRLKHAVAPVDALSVTDGALETEVLDRALDALLSKHPDARLTAMSDDGTQVELPPAEQFAGFETIPVPDVPSGMLGLIVPADRGIALKAWDQARQRGMARCAVRLLGAPERPITILLLDARHRYGVRLGLVVPLEDGAAGGEEVVVGTTATLRPRTGRLTKNPYATITDVDEQAERMLGLDREDLVGRRSLAFLHPEDHERAISDWIDFTATRRPMRIRVRHRTKDGGWLWVEVEHSYHHHEDPEQAYVLAELTDISDEMAAYEAIDQREKLFRRLTESLPVGLFLVHTDRTVGYINARLPRILGVSDATTVQEQLATVAPDDRPALEAALSAVLDDQLDQEIEVAVLLPDPGRRAGPEARRCAITLTALSDQEGAPGAIVTVSDVTEAARMREELRVRATFDALTGCHNRASTMTALDQALAELGDLESAAGLAVVFVDLDEFKPVNDEFGHAVGDDLLVHVATALSGQLRSRDLVGRIGGDEFLLICHGVSTPAEALAVGERISACLRHRVPVVGGVVDLQASIGVSLAVAAAGSSHHLSADSLVALADTAMYESKRGGDGTPVLSPETPV